MIGDAEAIKIANKIVCASPITAGKQLNLRVPIRSDKAKRKRVRRNVQDNRVIIESTKGKRLGKIHINENNNAYHVKLRFLEEVGNYRILKEW